MEDLDKSFDEEFQDDIPYPNGRRRVKEYIRQREKDLLKQLIIIRDTELSDTPMEKSRAAYNINLLIKELSNE